jgi:two-component system OmpR family sensor kinase/two-component system sensor histidine kinase QseC
MKSLRARLMVALLGLVVLVSLASALVTYRRVLSETSALFDYQLQQMALSLRGQVSLAPRIEIPPEQADADFVVQIWDLFGARVYLSRPGLPITPQPVVLGLADLTLKGEPWRAFGLQTGDGVIQIAQPVRVREKLARAAALRLIAPLLSLLPIMVVAVVWIVGRGLGPLALVTAEVERRDARSLTPLSTTGLPQEIEPLVAELNRLLERLQKAFAAQQVFLSDVAHELRSPLTALRLQSQLLERAPDEPARLEARTRLAAAIERASHLVEQLLSLARSNPREAAVSFERVDLAAVAAAALTDCHELAQSREIELGLDTDGPLPLAGDRVALHALLRNLIDNAVRYTQPGGSVQVRTAAGAERATVTVTDNGPGIPADERGRVFDRFYRRAETAQAGTGLGLAIVKAVAERHRAEVRLEDAPGGGLRVTVSFPSAP